MEVPCRSCSGMLHLLQQAIKSDLLTDPSGSRRFICIEVKDTIDTARPIDYQQLYAQAMYEIYHGERYWFDDKDEAILTQANWEFEQTSPAIQLFYHYFKAAKEDGEGEYLSPVEILDYLQKRATITLSSGKAYHFGRLLQKEKIPPANIRIRGRCIWLPNYKEQGRKVTIES